MKMVLRKEETSSCVGGTEEGVEDLASMMGVGRGRTAVGILRSFVRLEAGVREIQKERKISSVTGGAVSVGRTL